LNDNDVATPLLIDIEHLAKTKIRIEKNDPKLKPALDQLIEDA